ncbi:MAG: hypothetical protein ACLRFN_01655 [Alphaproteobacteria bacterium]
MTETIKSIIEWHEQTFPNATLEGQEQKYQDKLQELAESNYKDITELADMFIVACGICRFSLTQGMTAFWKVADLAGGMLLIREQFDAAVNEKMAINRNRKWDYNKGYYQHIDE